MIDYSDYPNASPRLLRMFRDRRTLVEASADLAVKKVREAMTRAPVPRTDGNVVDMASWNPERYSK